MITIPTLDSNDLAQQAIIDVARAIEAAKLPGETARDTAARILAEGLDAWEHGPFDRAAYLDRVRYELRGAATQFPT